MMISLDDLILLPVVMRRVRNNHGDHVWFGTCNPRCHVFFSTCILPVVRASELAALLVVMGTVRDRQDRGWGRRWGWRHAWLSTCKLPPVRTSVKASSLTSQTLSASQYGGRWYFWQICYVLTRTHLYQLLRWWYSYQPPVSHVMYHKTTLGCSPCDVILLLSLP